MPCQSNEIDANPHCKNHIALVHTTCKLDSALFGQFMGIETVGRKQHTEIGWLYILQSNTPRSYEQLAHGLLQLDTYLSRGGGQSVIIPLTENQDDKICLGDEHALFHELLDSAGNFSNTTEVWRMVETRPPRKRVVQQDMLIPGLKRMSHQLRVDFAVNVHGTDGKRKREPVRSIYEEAAVESNTRQPYQRRAKRILTENSPEISEIDEEEMTQHAKMLASLSSPAPAACTKPRKQYQSQYNKHLANIVNTLNKTIESIHQTHASVVASKDETIAALITAFKVSTNAVASKDETIAALTAAAKSSKEASADALSLKTEIIRMQEGLIATLQALG